jgi:hypothetical protein
VRRTLVVTLAVIIVALIGFQSVGTAAGPAATVAVWTGAPQSTAAGTNFQVALVAVVRDAGTNGVQGVTVTFAAPASGPSALFGGFNTTNVVTDNNGLAIAPTLTANQQGGSYGLTASVAGVATPATFSLTNTGGGGGGGGGVPSSPRNVIAFAGVGPLSITAIGGSPQAATAYTGFAAPLQVLVQDATGSPMGGVPVTFTAPGGGPTAFFGGTTTATVTTGSNGVATAPLSANGIAGTYLVNARVTGAPAPVSFSLTNGPGSGANSPWTNLTPSAVPQGGSGGNNCDYGTLAFVLDPQHPSTIYLGTCNHGIFKSTDSGATWVHINTGANGTMLDGSRQWTMVIDPVNPQVLYTNAGYGQGNSQLGANGAWKSSNGGVDWQQIWPPTDPSNADLTNIVQYNFVAQVSIDPTDHQHIFLSWHGTCAAPYTSTCFGESKDAGATWIMHNGDPRWQASEAQTIYIIDSNRWLFANHADGLWQTSDRGATWTLIDPNGAGHWPAQLYQARNGVFYIGADTGIYRSPDGVNWTHLPNTCSLVTGLVGDGTTMYASCYGALTPWVPVGSNPYLLSAESDGVTWTTSPWAPPLGAFTQGGTMAYDPVNHYLFSSNGTQGFWRVRTQ